MSKVDEHFEKIYTKLIKGFNLIPQEKLNYRILSRIKENEYGEVEEILLKRIGATELERLVIGLWYFYSKIIDNIRVGC